MDLWVLTALVPVMAVTSGALLARRRFAVIRVVGMSMAPAFQPGERVLVRRRAGDQIAVGAVVVLQAPHDRSPSWEGLEAAAGRLTGKRWLIKRSAAVGGQPVPEPARQAAGVAVVPAGTLVVLGDSPRSADSRTWGPVPMDQILGVVVRRFSPVAGDGGSAGPASADDDRTRWEMVRAHKRTGTDRGHPG